MIIEFWKTGENPITCYDSVKTIAIDVERIKKKTPKNNNNLRAVTFISKTGVVTNYESVVQASDKTGLNKNCIYEIISSRMKTGIELIAIERKRQIEELGYDYTNDSLYAKEELARAGATYAMPKSTRDNYSSYSTSNDSWSPRWWPWDVKYWKPTPEDRIKELSKAGALIAAQIDYLQNKNK